MKPRTGRVRAYVYEFGYNVSEVAYPQMLAVFRGISLNASTRRREYP